MTLKELNPKSGQEVMGCTDTEYVGNENTMKKSQLKELIKEVIKENQEIDVKKFPYKSSEDFRGPSPQERFWKDFYNSRKSDDDKEALNNILGWNQKLWQLALKFGVEWNSIKEEEIKSEFDNPTPGYIGRMSGDLSVDYKGSVKLGDGKTYYNTYTTRIDTRGFW